MNERARGARAPRHAHPVGVEEAWIAPKAAGAAVARGHGVRGRGTWLARRSARGGCGIGDAALAAGMFPNRALAGAGAARRSRRAVEIASTPCHALASSRLAAKSGRAAGSRSAAVRREHLTSPPVANLPTAARATAPTTVVDVGLGVDTHQGAAGERARTRGTPTTSAARGPTANAARRSTTSAARRPTANAARRPTANAARVPDAGPQAADAAELASLTGETSRATRDRRGAGLTAPRRIAAAHGAGLRGARRSGRAAAHHHPAEEDRGCRVVTEPSHVVTLRARGDLDRAATTHAARVRPSRREGATQTQKNEKAGNGAQGRVQSRPAGAALTHA